MMEEFLPRRHKRSFVFLLNLIKPAMLSVFLSSPFPWHTWCTWLCFSGFMGEQRCRKSTSHSFSLPLYLYFSPDISHSSSKPPAKAPLYHLAPRLLPIQLLHPTLKFLGGCCPIACLVHKFPSKIDILFLLGKNPTVGVSVQDNNSINKSSIYTSSNDNNDNKGTSQEIGCFGWIFPTLWGLRWSLSRQCHILPVQNSPLKEPVSKCLGAEINMGMSNKQRWPSQAK